MAQFGGEVLLPQAVQRSGRVHTYSVFTYIQSSGREVYRFDLRMPDDVHPLILVLLVIASSGFLHLVNGVL